MTSNPESAKSTQLRSGKLSAVVRTDGGHGWCGLENLTHSDHPLAWQLSPALTLEHYIGVPHDAPEYISYEPCDSDREIVVHGPSACTLIYHPLPSARVETRITYTIKSPHYVDVTVATVTDRADWPYGSLALFFATIVRAPLYTGVYLLGDDERLEGKRASRWLHFNGLAALPGRTAHPSGVEKPELGRPERAPETYYYDDSSVRFEEPLCCGVVGPLTYCLMFKREQREQVRFTVNPLAPAFGGPAWDFFWVIDRPIPGESYRLDSRIALMPGASHDDVQAEFIAYTGSGR